MVESRRYNKIPGSSPLPGSLLGCFLISLSRCFVPPRLSDEHSTQAEFDKSYEYVYGDFHSFSEGSGGGGTPHFATGMGAFLQSIVQGWAGVRYTESAITLRPRQSWMLNTTEGPLVLLQNRQ